MFLAFVWFYFCLGIDFLFLLLLFLFRIILNRSDLSLIIAVTRLLEGKTGHLLLLVDTDLSADPLDPKALVSHPKHLGLDQTLDAVPLVEETVVLLNSLGIPVGADVLSVGKALVGVGLEKEKAHLESIGVLLLARDLDTGVVILADDITRKILLKEGLGVLEGIVNCQSIDLFDHLTKSLHRWVSIAPLKGEIKGLLEGVGLIGADAKWRFHLRSLDEVFFGAITESKIDIVSAVSVWLVLAEVNNVNLEIGSSKN